MEAPNRIYTAEQICESLRIDISDILNIYPYGSKIYGTDDEYSDSDFIIVYKKSFLPSGAFKDNAISSYDRKIQGSCYSRSGFIYAINNYQMSALECIFLPEDKIIKKSMDFKINKFNDKEFASKVITTASSSWHNAILSYKDDNDEYVKKNIYHSLRILDYGQQIKELGKISDYSSTNQLKEQIYTEERTKPKEWHDMFISNSNKLKSYEKTR